MIYQKIDFLKKFQYLFLFILSFNILFSQFSILNRSGNVTNQIQFSSEPYVTGDDGIVRMYVNIIGHVKHPGIYLVHENVDILSLLSLAGGALVGAKLNKVPSIPISAASIE